MKDLIRALLGPAKCDWCTDRPPSVFDRLFRGDQLGVKHRWYEKAWYRLQDLNTALLPIWKLGAHWHFAHHINPNQQEES